MADRYPLIYNPSANQIQELQSGDSLDVGNSAIKGATGYATTTGTSSQFLKADGSLDGTTYLTASGTAQLAQGLTGTPTIDVSDVTGVNATFSGNLTVNGTTTTLDTNLTEVDKLEIAANNNNVAVAITQSGAGKAMTVEGGDVGIGTAVPVSRLHVAKSTEPSLYITNDSTGHTNADGLQIGFDGSNNAQIRNRENTNLKVYTNNTPRLTINGGGSVGIGTDNPSNLLHVYGQSRFEDYLRGDSTHNKLYIADDVAISATKKLYFDTGSNTYIDEVSADTLRFTTGGTERLRITSTGITSITGADDQDNLLVKGGSTHFAVHQDDTDGEVSLRAQDGSGSNNTKYMTFFTEGGSGTTERLRITPNGHCLPGADATQDLGSASLRWSNVYAQNFRFNANGNITYNTTANTLEFEVNGGQVAEFSSGGAFVPNADNTRDLGASNRRWANVYTGDLNLSNEGSANDVDGTWGQYTIQEGEDDLFLINRRTGKKYKFNLTEVD